MSSFKVFDTIQEVVFAIDEERNLLYGNNAASLLLEVTAKRLSTGKSMTQFIEFKPDIFAEGEKIQDVTEPTHIREVQYTTKDGKEGWAQVSVQAAPEFFPPDEKQPSKRWLLYFRDVSLERILAAKYKAELDQKEGVIEDLKKARAQLEDYSKNLEKMVEQRTVELRESNKLLATVLDSLGQGILVFDSKGQCLPIFSKICKDILETEPSGKPIAEVLKVKPSEKAGFDKWIEAVFSDMLSFEDLAPLGPSDYPHSAGRSISLNFTPMRNDGNQMVGTVVIATDRTSEILARKEAEKERNFAKMVVAIAKHRQQFRALAIESKGLLREMQVVVSMDGEFAYEEMTRWLHTLKGGTSSFGLIEFADMAHHAEQKVIDEKKSGGKFSKEFCASLLQDFRTMEAWLLNFLEKNAVLFGGLSESTSRQVEIPVPILSQWQKSIGGSPTGLEIFENYIKEPIGKSFLHIDSTIQELANSLGKKVEPLAMTGGDVKIIPEVYRELFATLIHAFRNAIDHGLEAPDLRVVNGKPEAGIVQLRFSRFQKDAKPFLRIEVVDDGRGIDPEKIKAKLSSMGKSHLSDGKSDEEVIQFVFANDFSTAERVSAVSGRGVGLSAVLEEAQRLGGTATVASTVGVGSRLIVEVPEKIELPAEHLTSVKAA